jgi:hypothetical protein
MEMSGVNIWKTFMGVTLLAAAAIGAIGSWFGWAGPTLATNSMGMVISVGDVIETIVAALIGVVTTFILSRRHQSNT